MNSADQTRLTLVTRGASGAPSPDASFALSADFTSQYELAELIGCGAMGMVHRAVERATRRAVAIKFLKAYDGNALARFEREGRVLARLAHPAVTAVLAAGQVDGHPYLVTELMEGGTLASRLSRGPFAWDEAVRIAAVCLDGLEACHAAGVVHRDLKPDNILFSSSGDPKLADLGVASDAGDAVALTATGALIGTPLYMPPEQLLEGQASVASDVWAMGAVAYQMIAGRPPYDAKNLADLVAAHQARPTRLDRLVPGVPSEVAHLIDRALGADPATRPPSAAAFAVELRAAARKVAVSRADVHATAPFEVPRAPVVREITETLVPGSPAPQPRSANVPAAVTAALVAFWLAFTAPRGVVEVRGRAPGGRDEAFFHNVQRKGTAHADYQTWFADVDAAEALAAKGQRGRAIDRLHAYLTRGDGRARHNLRAQALLARLCEEDGDHATSLEVSRNLAGLYPKSMRFAYQAALACYAAGEYADAAAHARRGAGLPAAELDRAFDEASGAQVLEELRRRCAWMLRNLEPTVTRWIFFRPTWQ